ncbi:hypothetical protein PV08_02110 [Exophiala spinifera]|uniref:Metallo-beta-lactamase domain-containing protein n=1 Tax=Exophiala spinifera TaxID=91928 RepID=A0A0D2BT06_9EURO|nr:uncharacterized protein PV08_02110 [Exophiala spinifera]KIW21530.1 hypothetical protein PV08_02110 [Exophiala spinifera]
MASSLLHPAKKPEALNAPPGASARVQIVDGTARLKVPTQAFMTPPIHGHTQLTAPTLSFLVEQISSGRKVLFDLGLRKDWQNHPPAVQSLISGPGWAFDVPKNVDEVLQENGVDVKGGAIEAVVWSHWHFDHIGDVSQFPASTTLITGPGVRDAFFPPYPENAASPLLSSDFANREHRELDFDGTSQLKIGGFRAIDYFGDGSFYLLDAPGHAIGHICGLARVASVREGDAEDIFIYMGGDTAHHGGEFRPTEYLPLPIEISPSPYVSKYASICPGHVFETIHPKKKGIDPYYEPSTHFAHNHEEAVHSIERMQVFDAADNVLVIIAHDNTILDSTSGLDSFPHGTLKNWKVINSAEKVRWLFLKDFVSAVEQAAS